MKNYAEIKKFNTQYKSNDVLSIVCWASELMNHLFSWSTAKEITKQATIYNIVQDN